MCGNRKYFIWACPAARKSMEPSREVSKTGSTSLDLRGEGKPVPMQWTVTVTKADGYFLEMELHHQEECDHKYPRG